VVVYNFGQVQRTSQVERKTKCSKQKTTAGDIAVLWTALFIIIFLIDMFAWTKKLKGTFNLDFQITLTSQSCDCQLLNPAYFTVSI